MARTPLLQSIANLFRIHEEADRRGLPVAAIRDERAERAARGLTRREVLAGSAVALAATALPRVARAAGAPRIAVIGGGISGVSAALTLADAGVACTVYESSGRIGGRMFSNRTGYWNDGQVSEWGGELIDTGHTTVQGLSKRFGLPLDDLHAAEPIGATETYYFFNQRYPF